MNKTRLKLLLLHCIPAAAVPIIIGATAVASTGLAVAQTVMSARQKIPGISSLPGMKEEKSEQTSRLQTQERETLRERQRGRTQNIFTSPLGAPLKSSIKSLLGGG